MTIFPKLLETLSNLFSTSKDIEIAPTLVSAIKQKYSYHGYEFFENDSKPWNLNIIGLRKLPKEDWNAFDDTILIVAKDEYKNWRFLSFPATTMPGTSVLLNPINPKGTAILKPGQWRGMWQIGKHKGKYTALTQKQPVTVQRFNKELSPAGKNNQMLEDTGLFGINCHKAGVHSLQVDGWSAGCQVFQSEAAFNYFMHICQLGANNWGNSFTYTLMEI